MTQIERDDYERANSTLRVQLGEEAFVAVWTQGRTMTVDEALGMQDHTSLPQVPVDTSSTISIKASGGELYPDELTARHIEILRLANAS